VSSLEAVRGVSRPSEGAYVLADQLAGTRCIEDALHGYGRLWRPVIRDRQRAARRSARWFVPESARQLRVRRAALRFAALLGRANRVTGTSLAGKQRPALRQIAAVQT
jgi:hypothetical protein